jgi:hypothetical protein
MSLEWGWRGRRFTLPGGDNHPENEEGFFPPHIPTFQSERFLSRIREKELILTRAA